MHVIYCKNTKLYIKVISNNIFSSPRIQYFKILYILIHTIIFILTLFICYVLVEYFLLPNINISVIGCKDIDPNITPEDIKLVEDMLTKNYVSVTLKPDDTRTIEEIIAELEELDRIKHGSIEDLVGPLLFIWLHGYLIITVISGE